MNKPLTDYDKLLEEITEKIEYMKSKNYKSIKTMSQIEIYECFWITELLMLNENWKKNHQDIQEK